MANGPELLRQLQQRRAPTSASALSASTSPSSAARMPVSSPGAIVAIASPAPQDEWITDPDGRWRRIRAHSDVPDHASDELAPAKEAVTGQTSQITGQTSQTDAATAGWDLVRQHNSSDACWIVVGGRVLDATKYLGHHPGGSVVIARLAGRDATNAYRAARHSRAADFKLYDYDIGAITDVKRLSRAAQEADEYRKRLAAMSAYLD